MTQRKKDGVREAILEAAFRQFAERGYAETSLPAIAREAGISTANVYVYFRSKLDILFTLYAPWLEQRLDRIEASLAKVADPQERLQRLLVALWRDLPRDSNGFANNVMQALATSATASGGTDYTPDLRVLFQRRVARWVADAIGLPPREAEQVAAVMLMAFDGFAMNARLPNGVSCTPAMARAFAAGLARPR